jgi:CRP-like cAMP-binding protein
VKANPEGREAILSFVNPGSWFGELAWIEPLERSRTVSCMDECELLVVPPREFDQLMHDPRFAKHMAELVAQRTRLLLSLLEDIALRSIRSRIARRLALLAHGDDMRTARMQHELSLSHEALASMLGLTRQSIALQLKALAGVGAIAQGYGRIIIRSTVLLLAEAACA